jgi:hypothetical protein
MNYQEAINRRVKKSPFTLEVKGDWGYLFSIEM